MKPERMVLVTVRNRSVLGECVEYLSFLILVALVAAWCCR